jgi:hypothetical protein
VSKSNRKANRRDADGNDRPAFVLEYPDDPELAKLVAAFERGDYMSVRREAPALAQATGDPRVRKAARELRRRIDPDPLSRYIVLGAFALLAFLTVWAYAQR